MSDITITKGDDKTFNLTFTESDGTAKDITGWTVFFTAKTFSDYQDNTDDDNAVISKTVTSHTDATEGLSAIALTDSDTDIATGQYLYDIQLKDDSGNITTVSGAPFNLTIIKDVTRRTT